MNTLNIGLIGYGTVGQGLCKILQHQKGYLRQKYNTEFVLHTICDRSIRKKNTRNLRKSILTTDIREILNNPEIPVVVELIGGLHPAKEIVLSALNNGKHVVTANKNLVAEAGKDLFRIAAQKRKHIYFESAVGAGIPIIKTLTEGIAGNRFTGLYGIINGTCNFVLSQMTEKHCSFQEALEDAKAQGYAESDPTMDINGMDSSHKLAIMLFLALGKWVNVKDIHREGITDISHADIAYADNLGLVIKLLAIAKKTKNAIEARVHPTLISKDHPLAKVDRVNNAVFLKTDPLGSILLQGEGAGQMSAAAGVLSDLINLGTQSEKNPQPILENLYKETSRGKLCKINRIQTKFYIRFMVKDRPGMLSKISGILGKNGISIASVSQKEVEKSVVPVVMLTDYTSEENLRRAIENISRLQEVRGKPVAIRMEKLS